MRSTALLIGTLLSVPLSAQAVEWFQKSTPLTQAHQNLLNNDLASMFASLVEVWQLDHNKNIRSHLDELLLQSLTVDCGKGLDNKAFPDWISGVTLRRIDIQSPGRDAYQVLIDAKVTKAISDIKLTQWVDKPLSSDSTFTRTDRDSVTSNAQSYLKRYNLNTKLNMGLYRLDITAADKETWSSWIIFGHPQAKQTVRWASKDQWVVEKNALLNRYCPLPKLGVSVFDYEDGKYKEIWKQTYESDYPTKLEQDDLPDDRYVLAVSMTHHRWQGPIVIEQSQVISKTYDVSLDE